MRCLYLSNYSTASDGALAIKPFSINDLGFELPTGVFALHYFYIHYPPIIDFQGTTSS